MKLTFSKATLLSLGLLLVAPQALSAGEVPTRLGHAPLPMEQVLSYVSSLPKDARLLPAPEMAFAEEAARPGPTIEAAKAAGWKGFLVCLAVGGAAHVLFTPAVGILVHVACELAASAKPAYLTTPMDTSGGSGDWLDPDTGMGDYFWHGDVYYDESTGEYWTEGQSLTQPGHYSSDGTYVGPEPESTCLREPCDESGTLD